MGRFCHMHTTRNIILAAVIAAVPTLTNILPARAGFVDWTGQSLESNNWLYRIPQNNRDKEHPELIIANAHSKKDANSTDTSISSDSGGSTLPQDGTTAGGGAFSNTSTLTTTSDSDAIGSYG